MAHDTSMIITSKIVALSSALAFALQIALALLMLRHFSPEEVGVFSVISQIGFFWTSLALAQTPLRLLAIHSSSVLDDAREAWLSSMQRFVWLLPVAALAIWWSNLSFVNTLLWALLLSLCQLTWMLAQSMRLRMAHAWAQVGVRVLPSLIALVMATVSVYMQLDGSALLGAALLGYAAGAAWLLPALLVFWRGKFDGPSTKSAKAALSSALRDSYQANTASVSGDNRSVALRIAHALADVSLATAIVVVWQRLYGPQETGWLAAPLRLMGFVPAVVHMAWAQVLLAQPLHARTNPLWVGLGGFACVALLGAGCATALEMGWLGLQWRGVWPYLFPLVVWQGSACLGAALSHLPFKAHCAEKYSWFCIGVTFLQGVALLAPFIFSIQLQAETLINWFTAISSIGLLALSWWLTQIINKVLIYDK